MSILKTVQDGSEFIKREGINGLMLVAIVILLGYYVWAESRNTERFIEILISSNELQRKVTDAEAERTKTINQLVLAQRESNEAMNELVSIALDKRLSDREKQSKINRQMEELIDITRKQIEKEAP